MSKPATAFTAQEMLLYRDQIIHSLKAQLDLFETMQKQGLFDADSGIFTKQNYPEKISIIEEEIKKLENFDVVLAVVGTMKAGKSTTINAIVGHEILPNRNRPMTALPTLIYHTPNQSTPKLTFNNPKVNEFVKNLQQLLQQNPTWHDNQELGTDEMQALINKIIKGWVFEKAYEGEEKIFEFLADLNDLVRLSETLCRNYQEHENKLLFPFNECKNIDQLPKIEVAFRYLSDMKENQGRLILLDTPGPNEAGQEHLRPMVEEQLQRCSAVLLVLDYTQLKSEASQEVKKQLEQVPTIERDRLFALVNKFDQKNANSDNEEQTKLLIFNDFLKNRVELEHIFPLAAQHAFLANRMATELEVNGKPDWDENSWVSDFTKLAYGTMEQDEWDEEAIDDIKNKVSRLIKRSKVQAPLDTAIRKTQSEAPRIAIQAALKKLAELFQDISNICELLATIGNKTGEEIDRLKNTLAFLNQYINELSETQKHVGNRLESVRQEQINKVQNLFKAFQDELLQKVEDLFRGEISKLQQEIAERKSKNRFNLISISENKALHQMENALQHLIKLNEGEEITLKNEQERDDFNNNLQQMYEGLTQSESSKIDDMVKSGMNGIQSELKDIEKQVQEIFHKIEEAFSKEKIHLELTVPTIKEAPIFKIKPISFANKFERKSKTTKIEKSGWWNKVLRSIHMGGYEERTSSYFVIQKQLIKEDFKEGLQKDFFKQAEQEVNDKFLSLGNAWVEDYIGKVRQRALDLIDETHTRINQTNQQKGDKEQYRKTIHELKKRNEEIRDDIAKVQNIFKSES